jgi:hypothetical protein
LQYLFADYLERYLSLGDPPPFAPPAYFTYNQELLGRAQKIVSSLLQNGSHMLLSNRSQPVPERRHQAIQESFHDFHRYQLSLLPGSMRTGRFRDTLGTRITQARFKKLWNSKFSRRPEAHREYGPEISWHVIRTYIKGMSLEPDEPFDLEDYQLLPTGQRTVSDRTFELVFERVYADWYRELTATDRWDDQDLAHALIAENVLKPQFPALFCDEAQDFTSLELEVLYRLSLYSNRTLLPYQINRVPLVFAGDPFQTLNPTGFSWDAIKANYTTKLLDNRMGPGTSGASINYQELQFNYRSSSSIVKFSNSVQALRKSLLGASVSPQQVWQVSRHLTEPQWFADTDPELAEQLRKQADLVIIVPTDEGNELEFVRTDPLLREVVEVTDGVPSNVLSPSRAKGLEFKRVMLYGFGAHAPAALKSLINNLFTRNGRSEPALPTPEELLPLEYYINRLYVAASRPKRRLFIVDAPEAISEFWRFVAADNGLEQLAGSLRRPERWLNSLGIMRPGSHDAWSADHESSRDVALKLRTEGLALQDSYLLRQAAAQFDNAGEGIQAEICRAEAYQIDGEIKKAVEIYLQRSRYAEAAAVLAENNLCSELTELAKDKAGIREFSEARLAQLVMAIAPDLSELISLIHVLEDPMQSSDFKRRLEVEEFWGLNLTMVAVRQVKGILLTEQDAERRAQLAGTFRRLLLQGLMIPMPEYGFLQYAAGHYAAAHEVWIDAGVEGREFDFSEEFGKLELRKLEYPEAIGDWEDAGQLDLIRAGFDAAGGVHGIEGLQDEQLASVVHALLADSRFDDVGSLAGLVESPVFYMRLAGDVLMKDSPDHIKSYAMRLMLQRLFDHSQFSWVEHVLRHGHFGLKGAKMQQSNRVMADYVSVNRSELLGVVIRIAARSEHFSAAAQNLKERLTTYLKNTLKGVADWNSVIDFSPLEAGAFLERHGHLVESLKFYERLEADPVLDKDVQLAAAKRWIAVKELQAKQEFVKGNSNNHERHHRHALTRRASINLAVDAVLPRFPKLEALDLTWPKPHVEPELIEPVLAGAVQNAGMGPGPIPVAAPREKPLDTADHEAREPKASVPATLVFSMGNLTITYRPDRAYLDIKSDEGESVLVRRDSGIAFNDFAYEVDDTGFLDVAEWGTRIGHAPEAREFVIEFTESGARMTFPDYLPQERELPV